MFENSTLTKGQTPEDRMVFPEAKPDAPEHALDGHAAMALHRTLMGYYRQEMMRQENNRIEQALDEDYYDHIQWTEEEAAALKERGQAPIVYNVLAQAINWIIGSEKRGRTDYKILPRGKEDAKPAEGKSKYMKYLSDVNRTVFHRSRAFEDAVKVGIGWIEVGAKDAESYEEPIYTRYENWRNMIWDSAATEIDTTDMRYQFRSKWVDEDVAKMLAPDRAEQIVSSVASAGMDSMYDMEDGDYAMDSMENEMTTSVMGNIAEITRRRVRLIEAWYRRPENVKIMRGGPFNGDRFDEADERHKQCVEQGLCKVISKGMMVTRVALMTPTAMLYDGPSPFKHNRFKFVPVWGYRRGRDNMPYGVIRGLRPIQDAVNKRASKALWILSTNKVRMEEGALPDNMTLEEFREEAARPDAILITKKGYEIDLNVDRNLGPEHIDQMSRDINMIQQTSGVTDELLGKETNAVSGVAVKARQEQGSITTNKLFDNHRLAIQMAGELELSLMEQYVTERKQFRITNQRGTPEFITLNDGLPENDVTRSKADFVISEADFRATMRQAASDQLIEMMSRLPEQVVLAMLDLVVEGMDVENRDEMVKRIRAVNGQRDPDASELTEEEMAALAAKAEQDAIMKRDAEATIGEKESKIAKTAAETEKLKREAISVSMVATTDAMTAATAAVMMPTTAKIADGLLNQAGWKGAHVAAGGMPQQLAPPPQPAQAIPVPPPPGQPQMAPGQPLQ